MVVKGMLAADIAAGIVGDRHDQHRIDRRIGQLRGIERGVEVLHAGGVAAVGDDHHHLAALARFQVAGCQVNRVVERRAGFSLDQPQRMFQRRLVVGEVSCGTSPRN